MLPDTLAPAINHNPETLQGLTAGDQSCATCTQSSVCCSPATLQDLCWKTIRRNISIGNVLELLHLFEQVNLPVDVKTQCIQYIAHAYETLRDRRPIEEIQRYLPPEMFERLEAAVEERRHVLELRNVKGQVRERPDIAQEALLFQPSVSGHPHSYAYDALKAGVKWPADVDPTCRELFLSEDGFTKVFGMSYSQYTKLPSWKHRTLKEQAGLF